MTNAHHPLKKLSKRCLLATLLALIIIWPISVRWAGHWAFTLNNNTYILSLGDGTIGYQCVHGTNKVCKSSVYTAEGNFGFDWPKYERVDLYGKPLYSVADLPLWIPFLLLLVPTLLIIWSDRRRRSPTPTCRSCHYNLTGNTSGVCPECGTSIPEEVRARLRASESHVA